MKLYVKDLESGEMLEVTGLILRSQSTSLGIPIEITMDDIDADPDAALCDEQGRLLKPEQPDMIPIEDALRFAEWVKINGKYNYVYWYVESAEGKCNPNFNTAELYEYWKSNLNTDEKA